VLETGEAREVHHFALLIGYGASAINPYVAFETIDDMIRNELLTGIDHKKACGNFVKAASKGVIKVMSKMGISAIQSYRGAQVFEALGLRQDVVDQLLHLDALARRRHRPRCHRAGSAPASPRRVSRARKPPITFCRSAASTSGVRDGEAHLFTPESIHALQKAVRLNNKGAFQAVLQAGERAGSQSLHAPLRCWNSS
jgi:glutamate synthase (ferredoxin)